MNPKRVKKKKKKSRSFSELLPEHLTPKQRDELRAMLAIGVPEDDACWAAGVHPSVFRRWMNAPYVEGEPVSDFVASIKAQVGRGVASKVSVVYEGEVRTKCENARWWLSRQRPEKFGREVGFVQRMTTEAAPAREGEMDDERMRQSMAVLEGEGVRFTTEVRTMIFGGE